MIVERATTKMILRMGNIGTLEDSVASLKFQGQQRRSKL